MFDPAPVDPYVTPPYYVYIPPVATPDPVYVPPPVETTVPAPAGTDIAPPPYVPPESRTPQTTPGQPFYPVVPRR